MRTLLARRLRQNRTDAERKLWSRLRRKQLEGARFRQQVPIGAYIVDFFCPEILLIVELDGGQHGSDEDRKRDQWLEAEGYRILRFWNNDVLQNTDGVVLTIIGVVQSRLITPTPTRPPQGGGGFA
jgi:ATP-dependent helicase HrpA/adenine-specific DNA-methyltransferase